MLTRSVFKGGHAVQLWVLLAAGPLRDYFSSGVPLPKVMPLLNDYPHKKGIGRLTHVGPILLKGCASTRAFRGSGKPAVGPTLQLNFSFCPILLPQVYSFEYSLMNVLPLDLTACFPGSPIGDDTNFIGQRDLWPLTLFCLLCNFLSHWFPFHVPDKYIRTKVYKLWKVGYKRLTCFVG